VHARTIARAAAIAFTLAAGPAAACGYCIEDRVAAVYDQAVVDHAVSRHQHVAFFSLNGALEAKPATRRALIAALDRAGIRGSTHVSLESASASVAFDPARASLASLAAAGGRALASQGVTLEALRIVGADGRLQDP
jgi:hypothetical protein